MEAEDRWQMCYQNVKLKYQVHPAEAVLKAAMAACAPTGREPNVHVVPNASATAERLFPCAEVYAVKHGDPTGPALLRVQMYH